MVTGDLTNSLIAYEEAYKGVENRGLIYDLNKSVLLRLSGAQNIRSSSESLIRAEAQLDNWMEEAQNHLRKTANELSTYLFSGKTTNAYEPKDFEKSLIGFNLTLNHMLEGRIDLAMVSAKKTAERETVIAQFNERKVLAIQEKESIERRRGAQVFSSVTAINGYPVNLIDSAEVRLLRNSYQSAAAHYLAGFIFEANNEPGLAAPGYRLALELKPSNPLFAKSLADLDQKITRTNLENNKAEVLIILETGSVPRLFTHRTNISFSTRKGPRIVTIRLPTVSQPINSFRPNSVRLGGQLVLMHEAVNLDAMVRRQLKDDMPGHVLKATTQAIVQILSQEAAQAAAERNSSDNGGPAGIFAALAVGVALSVGDADTRMWSTLPSRIWMGRVELPKGIMELVVPTPNGPTTERVNLERDYQVVHIRTLGSRAIVTSSGDQNIPTSDPRVAWASH
jgi:hypothetical protein